MCFIFIMFVQGMCTIFSLLAIYSSFRKLLKLDIFSCCYADFYELVFDFVLCINHLSLCVVFCTCLMVFFQQKTKV